MAAWNISEVILAEGLAEVEAEGPPASDLRFVNKCYYDLTFLERKHKPCSSWSKSSDTLESLETLWSSPT